ncbi:MAG TPA: glycosyltransferase family 2 protein [Candidatus Saccharimonadales bacterium]|nr:glycosyltransferase family 2 protein [Candidatus Saccharimonadales bacterium]
MIIYSIIATLLAGLLVLFICRLERSLHLFTIRKKYTAVIEAPSVSVCIPARNETHAMTQCLERVLSSDYRKMEVIVFDDESKDDTSILIKSFAHAGVRFVPGTPIPDGWVGKNHALEVLAREASGTYIIFMDVDTHIKTTTISQLVGYAMTENLQMASVIPERNDTWRASVLFGHLRYFWQLLLSRQSAPAASSSLWLINRRTLLNTIGGFGLHKGEVQPEAHLAALIGSKAYHCLVSNQELGVSYEKKWQSQYETSRRLLYPTAGGTWQGGLVGLIILTLLNLPFFVMLTSVVTGWLIIHTIAGGFVLSFALLYGRYTHAVWRRHWWIGVLVWPIVALQELIVFISSVIGYARRTITWKGRPVLAPPAAAKHPQETPAVL